MTTDNPYEKTRPTELKDMVAKSKLTINLYCRHCGGTGAIPVRNFDGSPSYSTTSCFCNTQTQNRRFFTVQCEAADLFAALLRAFKEQDAEYSSNPDSQKPEDWPTLHDYWQGDGTIDPEKI